MGRKSLGMFEIHEMVEQTLRSYPIARSSDDELIALVYGNYFGIRRQTFYEVVRYRKANGLPSFESITRARRKVQEENEDLRGNKAVEKARIERQLEFIKYSQGGR